MNLSNLVRPSDPHLKRVVTVTARATLVLGIVVLGILLGMIMLTPTGETVTAAVILTIYLIVISISPLHGLLLWIVTQPLADLYVNLSLGASIPDLSPTRICLGFITILILARASVGRIKLVPFTKVDFVAILFMIGITLSGPSGRNGWQTLQEIFDQQIVPILVYFLAKNLIKDKKQLNQVLFAILILATYVGLYAIYEQLTGNILFTVREGAKLAYGESGLRILRGLLAHPHSFGRILGIAIPLNFYMLLEEKRSARRLLYLFTLGIMFGGLYLAYRRTAWIAAVASLFLVQWFYPRFRNLFLVLLVVAAAAMLINQDVLDDSAVATRAQAGDTATLNGRTEGWEFAIELWEQQPLTGYGYGQFNRLARRAGRRDTAIESQYFSILVSAGLLGFLPYVLLLITLPVSLIPLYRNKTSPIKKELIVMYWAAHLSYIINAYTATVGQIVTTSTLLLFAGALAGVQAWSVKANQRTHSDPAPSSQPGQALTGIAGQAR